jgi:hypothetical protein
MLIPWWPIAMALYVVSAILVLSLTVSIWRRRSISLSIRYSALLFATVLIAPHLTVYDLVILAPALLLLSDQMLAIAGVLRSPGQPRQLSHHGLALYCVYLLPLIGPLAKWTHVQLSVIAMTGVLWLTWKQSRSADSFGSRQNS